MNSQRQPKEAKNVHLLVRCDCPDCDGLRQVDEPLWAEFACWSDQRGHISRETAVMAEAESRWWADRGYPGGPNCWPPDRHDCDTCQGLGYVQRWLPWGTISERLAAKAAAAVVHELGQLAEGQAPEATAGSRPACPHPCHHHQASRQELMPTTFVTNCPVCGEAVYV